jgi:hypothetical protein
VKSPVPAIEISNLGIPFSTVSTRWPVIFPLLSKRSSPDIEVSYQTYELTIYAG